jgi:hypothetical protein
MIRSARSSKSPRTRGAHKESECDPTHPSGGGLGFERRRDVGLHRPDEWNRRQLGRSSFCRSEWRTCARYRVDATVGRRRTAVER